MAQMVGIIIILNKMCKSYQKPVEMDPPTQAKGEKVQREAVGFRIQGRRKLPSPLLPSPGKDTGKEGPHEDYFPCCPAT